MRHQNSVFHSVLKIIPWSFFDKLVEEHQTDKHIRCLSSKSQLVALLYAQFSGTVSLRGIASGLSSHAVRLYHTGTRPVRRSTLSDANSLRSHEVFSDLFAEMVRRANRGLRRKIGESLYLIDSTSLRLNSLSADWARFSAAALGAKAHVIYDADAERPVYHHVTAARVNDITAAKAMPIEPGATYVFDLGYYDYGWWAELDAAGCRFVTRLKKNTPLTVTAELEIASEDAGHILSDRIGLLPARQAKSRKNPFSDPVREVRVNADNGTILRIISNDLDTPAAEIAELYKRRWAIELFFRWVKQTLKIKHFYGTSENAVRIQIAVALIAYLLLQTAHKTQSAVPTLYQFAQLVRVNLMHLKPLDRLLLPEKRRFHPSNQMELSWA